MISDLSTKPAWFYNEYQQIGTNFEDPAQVAAYCRNQGSTAESEQTLVDQLGIRQGHTMIDLGCGAGTFAIQAARVGGQIDAVDISQTMLTYAQKQAEAAEMQTRIKFHHCGFLTYEHSTEPVDFIVTKLALHHLPDFWKMTAILRMAAMLKDNGVLYLRDVVFSFNPVEYKTHINAWLERATAKAPDQGWTINDFETHVREEYTTFAWILEGMLQRAGFKIVKATPSLSVWAEYICQKV